MTLRVSDLQSDSDLDSSRNSCDVSNDMCSKDMFSNDLCSFRFWFLLKVLSQERRWWFQRVSIDFVFIKSKELEFYERKILPVVFHSFLKHYWQ